MIRSGQAAYGRFMLRTGHLPTRDTWSWTVHGHGLVVSAWLFDLLLGFVARGGGVSAAVPVAFCLLVGWGVHSLCRGAGDAAAGVLTYSKTWRMRPTRKAVLRAGTQDGK